MSNWFVFSMEPSELEARFGSDHTLSYDPEDLEAQAVYDLEAEAQEEEMLRVFTEQMDKVNTLMKFLDPVERDYLNLYFNLNKDQNDIARIFGITQGAVSYRCKIAIERIKFLLSLPRLHKDTLIEDLDKIMPDGLYTKILVLMYETSSQSAVARALGFSQGQVRYRLLRALEFLNVYGERDPLYKKYYDCFEYIRSNPNIIRNMNIKDFWIKDEELANLDTGYI